MASLFFFLSSAFLVLLLPLASGADVTEPQFTTSATIVPIGRPFTATCTLSSPIPPTTPYYVHFIYDNEYLFRYNFDHGYQTAPTLYYTERNDTKLSVRSLAYNATVLQIEITPKAPWSHTITCDQAPSDQSGVYAKESVTVKAIEHLPAPAFSLNLTKPSLGHPFTATCDVSVFHLLPTAQKLVRFYSKKEGLLATYETIKGQNLIVIQKHGDLGVQDGARTGNEIYDLVLVEKKEVTQSEYWCTLEEATFGVTESAHWIEEPVVRFTSTKVNATTRLGTCSLENFEPSGKDYSVQFWSESGLKVVNRLASFAVRQNKILEFLVEEVPGWDSILPGEALSFPKFSIQVTPTHSSHGVWWCVLGVGAEGSTGYRKIKSSLLTWS